MNQSTVNDIIKPSFMSNYQTHSYPSWLLDSRDLFQHFYNAYNRDNFGSSFLDSVALESTVQGRRIRPTLYFALWQNRFGKHSLDKTMALPAIALELFHAASIIVDDIIDAEPTRRDKKSLCSCHGPGFASLTSHYLISKGYAALERHPAYNELSTTLTTIYKDAALGQSYDIVANKNLSLYHQQKMSLRKTATFFCFVGETIDYFSQDKTAKLSPILGDIGECFQISNDVFDLLYLQETQRHDTSKTYPLNLSFLIPQLVDAGVVKQSEVFSSVSYNRLLEISAQARDLFPDDAICLKKFFYPVVERIECCLLPDNEKEILLSFIEQLYHRSFWMHPHE